MKSPALYMQKIGRATRADPRRDYYIARRAARIAASQYFKLMSDPNATGWDKTLANRDMHDALSAVPGGMTYLLHPVVMLPGWYARRQKYAAAIARTRTSRHIAKAIDHMAREFSPRPALRIAA